jgi:hypothetical protein
VPIPFLEDPNVPSYKTQPPWEFLMSASRTSLQSYELSRLSHAANLRKEISALMEQWIEENSNALLARWLMQYRERETLVVDSLTTVAKKADDAKSASDNFFADCPPAQRAVCDIR